MHKPAPAAAFSRFLTPARSSFLSRPATRFQRSCRQLYRLGRNFLQLRHKLLYLRLLRHEQLQPLIGVVWQNVPRAFCIPRLPIVTKQKGISMLFDFHSTTFVESGSGCGFEVEVPLSSSSFHFLFQQLKEETSFHPPHVEAAFRLDVVGKLFFSLLSRMRCSVRFLQLEWNNERINLRC
jgi:hypothetical protein